MFSDIQPKLLVCSKIANEFDSQIKGHHKVVDEKGVLWSAAAHLDFPAFPTSSRTLRRFYTALNQFCATL
jgi:hypothetical protein